MGPLGTPRPPQRSRLTAGGGGPPPPVCIHKRNRSSSSGGRCAVISLAAAAAPERTAAASLQPLFGWASTRGTSIIDHGLGGNARSVRLIVESLRPPCARCCSTGVLMRAVRAKATVVADATNDAARTGGSQPGGGGAWPAWPAAAAAPPTPPSIPPAGGGGAPPPPPWVARAGQKPFLTSTTLCSRKAADGCVAAAEDITPL
jgi:hypothetical protein